MGLFDPNRWPKPYPIDHFHEAVRRRILILVAVVVGLLILLPALAD